jgi:hypothetical protein
MTLMLICKHLIISCLLITVEFKKVDVLLIKK